MSEVVGQEHVTDTLTNALNKGRISHAYLFTGPHGVGKTSVARAFAFALNKLPYTGDGSQHLDVIEIDAASNRRIDEIRDLRDKVHTAPTSADYKVYIIDEVHMLTKEAFNALLKTLEEPPAHVVFILATTEPHKLPDTIISRTQRHNFLAISENNMVQHLQQLAKQEKLNIDDEALRLVARHSGGSARDAVSLLDQLGHQGQDSIGGDDIRQLLGLVATDALERLVAATQTGSPKEIVTLLDEQFAYGATPASLAEQLIETLRNTLSEEGVTDRTIELMNDLLEVPTAFNPRIKLETVLVGHNLRSANPTFHHQATVSEQPRVSKPAPSSAKPVTSQPAQPVGSAPKGAPLDDAAWQAILDELKKQYNSLYAVARMAAPRQLNPTSIELCFRFPFHQKQITTSKNRQILENIVAQVLGSPTTVQTRLDENTPAVKPSPAPSEQNSTPVSSIIDLMGGGEVVNLQ